jgi:hypothetical protein
MHHYASSARHASSISTCVCFWKSPVASQSTGGSTHRITASCGIVIQQIHRQIPLSTRISPCEFLAQGHEIHERKSFHSCMHSIERQSIYQLLSLCIAVRMTFHAGKSMFIEPFTKLQSAITKLTSISKRPMKVVTPCARIFHNDLC